MDWLDEVRLKVKKKNKVLFSQENLLIQTIRQMIDQQNHRTVALWAFELADETVVKLYERYPHEKRPQKAVEIAKAWAAGHVKMPVAQRAILDAHAFAKELKNLEDVAYCHAVGQACGVVHGAGHAVGFPIYDLTALVRRFGVDNCKEVVEQRVEDYLNTMLYWKNSGSTNHYVWADFMMKDK